MAGFGSTLRQGRRTGWEKGAYLDYETLKLLLSQIEAVYEETAVVWNNNNNNNNNNNTNSNNNNSSNRNNKRQPKDHHRQDDTDYRNQLFQESDSDLAYESPADHNQDHDEDHAQDRDPEDGIVGVLGGVDRGPPSVSYPFAPTLSYEEDSHVWGRGEEQQIFGGGLATTTTTNTVTTSAAAAKGKDSEDEDDDDSSTTTGCHPFRSWKKPSLDPRVGGQASVSSSASLLPHNNKKDNAPLTFHLTTATTTSTRLRDAPFVHEGSSLLSTTTPVLGTAVGVSSSHLPPPPPQPQGQPTTLPPRQRRRKKQSRKQKEQQKHLLLAHSKARAITERFLGLLRAETEKILLFAQSRLGELADTAGALRFPHSDNDPHDNSWSHPVSHHFHHGNDDITNMIHRHNAVVFYPDGGLHPSSSSSEDEGFGAATSKSFPWTDEDEDYYSDQEVEEDSISDRRHRKLMVDSRAEAARPATGMVSSSNTTTPVNNNKRKLRSESVALERKLTDTAHDVRRQINHFAEIRKRRPIFQRSDQILGEDMLMISAVEEADCYTSVAVELMHVLRYICVNLLAVRKICRKHDRLLMNRMLGGYYQRARAEGNEQYAHIEDATTLGGLVARISGDIYEAHPALIGQMTYYKLVGVYDHKIQKLANSRTVQVVSSCLALALSEFEVATSRAEALAKPKNGRRDTKQKGYNPSVDDIDEMSNDDPPSTASRISLTRLRFAVTSIFGMREAARHKVNNFGSYVSRALMSYTGQSVAGEGLDGCSRNTLDFIVSYDPDAILLLDTSVLHRGIKSGNWMTWPMGDVMISTLSTAVRPEFLVSPRTRAGLNPVETVVAEAVSLTPGYALFKRILKGHLFAEESTQRSRSTSELPYVFIRLNRMLAFLFAMNYFVAHSTTMGFIGDSGAPTALVAVVLGIPNLSAIFIAFVQCSSLSRANPFGVAFANARFPLRRFMISSSVLGFAGNLVHGIAVNRGSVPLAVIGRLILGFSNTDVIQRHILSSCLPAYIVSESVMLAQFRLAGVVIGLLASFLTGELSLAIQGLSFRTTQSSSWLMAFFWLIMGIRCFAQLPSFQQFQEEHDTNREGTDWHHDGSGNESDSSDSVVRTPSSMLYRSTSEATEHDPFLGAYGSVTPTLAKNDDEMSTTGMERESKSFVKKIRKQLKTFTSRLVKLMMFHTAIPICALTYLYCTYAFEILFTSAPLVTNRYFLWSGARAGLFLGLLAILIFPVNFFCELVARRYGERVVMKVRGFLVGSCVMHLLECAETVLFSPFCVPEILCSRHCRAVVDHQLVVSFFAGEARP